MFLHPMGFWAGGVRQVVSQSSTTYSNGSSPHMPCRLSDTDGIILYTDNASSALKARHFSLDESTYALTIDSELNIRSGSPAGETEQQLIPLDATNALCITQVGGSAGVAVVITNTAGTLSKGSETTVQSGTNVSQIAAARLDSTHVIMAVRDTSTTIKARVLSISGTTVTAGTEVQFTDATSQFPFLAAMSSSRAILMSGNGEAYMLTISGTTISSGSKQTISGVIGGRYGQGVGINSSLAAIAYNETSVSPQALVVILRDNMDGTITGGAPTPVLTQKMDTNNSYGMSISRINDNRALVGTLGIRSAGSDQGFFAEVLGIDGMTPNQNLGDELFETGETWGGSFAFCKALSERAAVLLGTDGGTPILYSWKVQ